MNIAWVDGGCQGNGSKSAKSYGSYKINDEQIVQLTYSLDEACTNNEAEYVTLIRCLTEIRERELNDMTIHMDSALVVNQVVGKWAVNAPGLYTLNRQAKWLVEVTQVKLIWVPRKQIVEVLGH